MQLFLVGGAVRDALLQRTTKDWDFAVVHPDGFAGMVGQLQTDGFELFLSDEQHGTVRARAPRGWMFAGHVPPVRTFDFVLARQDVTTDGRHATTRPGTLLQDLARRDFTVNAIALTAANVLLDPHNGQADLRDRVLRTVGDPTQRLTEDGLRALRALRFVVTLGFAADPALVQAIRRGGWFDGVSTERVREELLRAMRHDTVQTLRVLEAWNLTDELLADSQLWLRPTMEQR